MKPLRMVLDVVLVTAFLLVFIPLLALLSLFKRDKQFAKWFHRTFFKRTP